MEAHEDDAAWRYYVFHLFVTGETEQQFLPRLFRSLMANGNCTFRVASKVPQRDPITSAKKLGVRRDGVKRQALTKDEVLGMTAKRLLNATPNSFVILVDDLEHARRQHAQDVFERYRHGFDAILNQHERTRVSVHFLVNMLEAYYFADPAVTNDILGTALDEPDKDVEHIRHPKGKLEQLFPGFNEVNHGGQILNRLNLERILSEPEWCASLRTMVKWCVVRMNGAIDERFQLLRGKLNPLTELQLST